MLRTRRTNSDPKGEHGDRQSVACTRSRSEAGDRSNPAGQEDLFRDVARRTGFLELFRRLVPRPTRRSRFATMHGAPSRRTAATFTARERYNDSAVPGGLGVGDRGGHALHQGPASQARATRTGQEGRTRPWAIAMISQWPKVSSSAMIGAPSRQAYQALKSLATHKTDRNDARGLAHLARTGFFKLVHVKSLQAHALRSLIRARKKLVGQRVTLENQIRGLAVVFGVRLPRALAAAFIDNALRASEGIVGLSAAVRGLIAARTAVMTAVAAIDADMRRMTRASAACRRLMT